MHNNKEKKRYTEISALDSDVFVLAKVLSDKVLDKGFVRLVESMGNDLSIVQAARVSYGQATKGEEQDRKLLSFLSEHQHGTPFEMVQFKFHVKCPIFVMRQWIRHRIGSFNEISGRYAELKDEYYHPLSWRKQDIKNKQGSSENIESSKSMFSDSLLIKTVDETYHCYRKLLSLGIAKEMARMVLPVNFYTEFYWCVNARSLMNFLKLRLDSHAQFEIQEYARAVYRFFKLVVPWTAEDFLKQMCSNQKNLRVLESISNTVAVESSNQRSVSLAHEWIRLLPMNVSVTNAMGIHTSLTEAGNINFEWRNDNKKLTVEITPEATIEYILIENNDEMKDGNMSISDFQQLSSLWNWLNSDEEFVLNTPTQRKVYKDDEPLVATHLLC